MLSCITLHSGLTIRNSCIPFVVTEVPVTSNNSNLKSLKDRKAWSVINLYPLAIKTFNLVIFEGLIGPNCILPARSITICRPGSKRSIITLKSRFLTSFSSLGGVGSRLKTISLSYVVQLPVLSSSELSSFSWLFSSVFPLFSSVSLFDSFFSCSDSFGCWLMFSLIISRCTGPSPMFKSTVREGFSGQGRFGSAQEGGSLRRHCWRFNKTRRCVSGGFSGDLVLKGVLLFDLLLEVDGPGWFKPDGPENKIMFS